MANHSKYNFVAYKTKNDLFTKVVLSPTDGVMTDEADVHLPLLYQRIAPGMYEFSGTVDEAEVYTRALGFKQTFSPTNPKLEF